MKSGKEEISWNCFRLGININWNQQEILSLTAEVQKYFIYLPKFYIFLCCSDLETSNCSITQQRFRRTALQKRQYHYQDATEKWEYLLISLNGLSHHYVHLARVLFIFRKWILLSLKLYTDTILITKPVLSFELQHKLMCKDFLLKETTF